MFIIVLIGIVYKLYFFKIFMKMCVEIEFAMSSLMIVIHTHVLTCENL